MVRLQQTYDEIYFGSFFGHLVVRFLFLWIGWSAAFRDSSNFFAKKLLALKLVEKTVAFCGLLLSDPPLRNLANAFLTSRFGGLILRFARLWQPLLIRSAYVYYIQYTVLFTLLWLPLSYYSSYILPHRYGLSHEPINLWLIQLAEDSAVDMLLSGVLFAAVVWGILIYPRRFAFIFALWSAPIIFLGIFFNPFFDRLDNHFTPLPASSALYAPLHRLAANSGVPSAEILVADKSKQTNETNAYVTGLGSSAQIVLWDTLIKTMPPDEIVAITGHELGHYVEHHVIIGGVLAALSMFIFLPIVKLLAELLLAWFGPRFKIANLADPAALPIFAISLSLLTFVLSPVTNGLSRMIEHRADSFGLAATGNRLAMAHALVDLSNENLSNPYPPRWEVFWLDDHPPFGERIKFALTGQPFNGPRPSVNP